MNKLLFLLLRRFGLALVLGSMALSASGLGAPPRAQVFADGDGAGWNHYVEYLHRLAGSVQTEWQAAAGDDRLSVPEWVTVKLVLNRDGEVEKIQGLEEVTTLAEPVRQAITRAISAHGSYGIWTEAMTQKIGSNREVSVQFYFPATDRR